MTRIALALALALGWGGLALAQTLSPNVASPFTNASGPASRESLPPPLPPRADGVPADLAFGAYQRGNFLYALMEAERRLDANPKDAAAMTARFIATARRSPATIAKLRAGGGSPAISAILKPPMNSERCCFRARMA
jgi:hypothetical protein